MVMRADIVQECKKYHSVTSCDRKLNWGIVGCLFSLLPRDDYDLTWNLSILYKKIWMEQGKLILFILFRTRWNFQYSALICAANCRLNNLKLYKMVKEFGKRSLRFSENHVSIQFWSIWFMVSNCSNCFKRCAWLEKKEETFFYISVPWQGLPINDIYPGNSTHSKVVFREVLHPIELE